MIAAATADPVCVHDYGLARTLGEMGLVGAYLADRAAEVSRRHPSFTSPNRPPASSTIGTRARKIPRPAATGGPPSALQRG